MDAERVYGRLYCGDAQTSLNLKDIYGTIKLYSLLNF